MFSLPVWIASLLFALVHSLFAAESCKGAFYRLGMSPQYYRLIYSIFALLLTLIWLVYIYQLPDESLYQIGGWVGWLMVAIQLGGLWIVLLSLKAFDARLFLGLLQAPATGDPFHEHGIYRHIRHPIYSGVMLALLFSPMQTVNSLNLALAVCLCFVAGARLEERRMQRVHPAYADYKKRVPAFIPHRFH